MAIAKSIGTKGQGWHRQSVRHSNARKNGVAGGVYKSIYYPAHFQDNKGQRVSFNLYEMEGIDFNATKGNVINHFDKERLPELKKIYSQAGLEITDTNYYSPSSYNF